MIRFILTVIFLASFTSFAPLKPVNYAGSWMLDKAQSKNLPMFYDNIKSHKLLITQNEKLLNVVVEIATGESEPEKFNLDYYLNGSESKTELPVRTPKGTVKVPTTLKAFESDDGKLQITITRELSINGSNFKGVTTEDWQISDDGKTLRIHKTDEMPQGKMESDMIFVKE